MIDTELVAFIAWLMAVFIVLPVWLSHYRWSKHD